MRFHLVQPLVLERSVRGHIPRPDVIVTIQLLKVCLIKCLVDSIPSTICSHGGVQRWLIKRTLVDPTLYNRDAICHINATMGPFGDETETCHKRENIPIRSKQ